MCPGEVVLPDALEKVGYHVFSDYPKIRTIWVENRFVADSLRHEYDCIAVFSEKATMVGDKLLRDLRRQKDVVIPDGVQEIGE